MSEKSCEAAQPQYHMAIENFELNWRYFLKLDPWETFLQNPTVAELFIKFFG